MNTIDGNWDDLEIRHSERKEDTCGTCEYRKPVVKDARGGFFCGYCAYDNQVHLQHLGEK